ncbi:MAG: transcription antitermination factor NusB [Phycisphaerales bacterium]
MATSTEVELGRDARDFVISRLAGQAQRFPELDLAPMRTRGLDARDDALAQALYTETVRRWLTLERLVGEHLSRPFDQVEPKMRAALLAGACQLFFFDRLPDHAVVNETVEWAGRRIRPKARGMVNAVLRRLVDLRGEVTEDGAIDAGDALPLSDGRWRRLARPIVEGDRHDRLAFTTSHPRPLVERWSKRVSPAELARLLAHNLTQPPTIVAGLSAEVVSATDELEAHREPGFAVWTGTHDALAALLRAHVGARVQDPASADAIERTRELDLDGQIIVDACAGLGTKTEQLAAIHPDADIIASDPDPRRFEALRERFDGRAGVRVAEPDELIEWAGRAALVVLDVPCSNSGVLARRIEAKYRMDDAHLRSLVDLQRQIIADHLRLRAPDGRVLYSTCSLEPEENEEQARWIVKWHRLRIAAEGQRRPGGTPGESPTAYSDGSYHVVLE